MALLLVMHSRDVDRIANSADPDQTAPVGAVRGAVWSGSALFAQTYLSENLGSLRYYMTKLMFVQYLKKNVCIIFLNLIVMLFAWFSLQYSDEACNEQYSSLEEFRRRCKTTSRLYGGL